MGTDEQKNLRLARKLRGVMVDRSGDAEWLRVDPRELIPYLADSDDIEESADIVESYSIDPSWDHIAKEPAVATQADVDECMDAMAANVATDGPLPTDAQYIAEQLTDLTVQFEHADIPTLAGMIRDWRARNA